MLHLSRRVIFHCLTAAVTLAVTPAPAADAIKVGVLRFVSSGGLFLAQERGYFKDEGLEAEFIYFESAQPVSVAVASSDISFGVTAITGGTLNLAGKGAVKMIASQGAERKGFKGNALIVSNAAFARGVTGFDKLGGTSFAITQVGSSQHYMIGQIAAAENFDFATVDLKPLQSIPNMLAAVKSGQVDATLAPAQFAKPMAERGEAKMLGYFSEVADYQYGAVFTSPKLIAENAGLAQRFVNAYQKGNADYARAFLRLDAKGEAVTDDATREAAALIGKYVYPSDTAETAAPKITAAAVFVDAKAALDPAEIDRQIAWYKKEKLVGDKVDSKDFIITTFAR